MRHNNKYSPENIEYSKLKNKIEVPKFQRSIVWNDDLRKNFIKTVSDGFPFGSLLVYVNENENEKYLLIDGLQRFSTLKDFEMNPFNYINPEEDAKDDIENLINFILKFEDNLDSENALHRFKVAFRSTIKECLSKLDGNFTNKLIISLVEGPFPYLNNLTASQNNDLRDNIDKMILKLKSLSEITNLVIPIIKYTGDKKDLPGIFENMNSNGTSLSRYEIFAATWNDIKFENIEDEEILTVVDKKYERMIKRSNIEIKDYTPGIIMDSKSINLFEYCCAIGKLLTKNSNYFFLSNRDNSSIDSIGFSVLTSIFQKHLRKMDTLNQNFSNITDFNKLTTIKQKMIQCTIETEEIFKGYLRTVDDKTYHKHSEYQMISFIVVLFNIKYKIDNSTLDIVARSNSHKLVSNFKRYAPFHYLFDILKNHWAGAGDNKLEADVTQNIENHRYLSSITKDTWKGILHNWMEDQEKKKSSNISEEKKIFLHFITRKAMQEFEGSDKKFDIEHCVPKENFNHENLANRELPISALGNLCIFPSHENRSKKDATMYQHNDRRLTMYKLDESIIKEFHYPSRDELQFVGSTDFNFDTYIKFINQRHKYYIEKFLEVIVN